MPEPKGHPTVILSRKSMILAAWVAMLGLS